MQKDPPGSLALGQSGNTVVLSLLAGGSHCAETAPPLPPGPPTSLTNCKTAGRSFRCEILVLLVIFRYVTRLSIVALIYDLPPSLRCRLHSFLLPAAARTFRYQCLHFSGAYIHIAYRPRARLTRSQSCTSAVETVSSRSIHPWPTRGQSPSPAADPVARHYWHRLYRESNKAKVPIASPPEVYHPSIT
jgi:hypothetical protein